ncbi:hypothetical protein BVRB_9g221070 [Beta vulgaris subsp. vulgaris]|nr:hypothetical protein BVRB_9g221070 [Beta vulgaris subsp. vulgaris]
MRPPQPYNYHSNHHYHHRNYHTRHSKQPPLLPTPPQYRHSPPFGFHQAPPLPPISPTYYHHQPPLLIPKYKNVNISPLPLDHHTLVSPPPAELRVYSPSSPFYSSVSPNYCGNYYYPHTTSDNNEYDHADYYSPWSPKYSLPSPVYLPPSPSSSSLDQTKQPSESPDDSPPSSPVYSPSSSPLPPSFDHSLPYSPSYVPYTP